MKRCPKCAQYLSLDSFASRGLGKGPVSYCRDCQNDYSRAHYRRYKRPHNLRRYENRKRYYRCNIDRLRRYLAGKCCVDCGETDIRVLEFDHVRGQKMDSVAELCGRGVNWRRIELEIAKCEIRCANCHRRKTVIQRGWWRGIGA